MADSKITALTAISTVDPAADPLVIVDVSDTSMAASGTTKKATINQLLGASGTATLASATITGNLTVDTNTFFVDSANNRVGIGTATPAASLHVASGNVRLSDSAQVEFGGSTNSISGSNASNLIEIYTNNLRRNRIDSNGVATWSNVGGVAGDAMTLNANGLGVGVAPSAWASNRKALQVGGLASAALALNGTSNVSELFFNSFINTSASNVYVVNGRAGLIDFGSGGFGFSIDSGTQIAGAACNFTRAMTLDASGNLLVGTTTNTNLSRVFSRGTATSSALALQGASGDVALAQLTVGKFDNNSTTSQIFVRFTINDNSGGSGQINANGASQAAFGTFSDSRLKENIVSLPSQLANILSLRPVEFDYKDGSGHQIGFVAQEVQDVYSDAVSEQDGFLTVTGWSKTEARLVSAIKELAAKVQALEAKLA